MATKFLNGIDLGSTELKNAVVHLFTTATFPSTGAIGQLAYNSSTNELKYWDGAWKTITNTSNAAVDYINGGSFAAGTGVLTLTGVGGAGATINLDGRYSTASFSTIAVAGSSNVVADDKADTLTFAAGTNVTITTNATTDTVEIASTDNYANAASFDSGTGDLTIERTGALGDLTANLDGRYLQSYTETQTLDDVTTLGATTTNSITVGGLVVNGAFTVSGAVQSKVSETLLVEDALFVLNSNEAGAPTNDAGFVVERGTATNVMFVWDESADKFIFATTTETGGTAGNAVVSDYSDIRVGGLEVDDTLNIGTVVNAGTDTDKFLVLDASGNVDFRTGAEVSSDIDVTGSITAREYAATIGNGTLTTITVTHGLDSQDVIVQLYNTSYETVYADVVRTNNSDVDITFATAPALNSIRVLVIKVG